MLVKKYQKYLLYIVLLFGVFISLYPFFWILINATWGESGVFAFPPHSWFGDKLVTNFKNLDENVGILRVFFNSAFVSIVSTVLTLFVSLCSGYAFAKFNFKGKKTLFSIYLFSMMMPYQATIISLFNFFLDLDLMDSYTALIVPGLCNVFTIFLLRQALNPFPDELLEAGRMDGANELKILFRIVIPNAKPALAAATIFIFMASWNNFMWPLIIVSDPEMRTLPLALSSLKGVDITDYGQIMMGISIATVPIIVVFLAMSKHFISGVLGTGSKG